MNIIAKVLFTDRFEIDGNQFVKIQACTNDKGVFCITVKESLVPDFLEGKEACFCFDIGFDKSLKPYLKIKGITLDTNLNVD